MKALADKPGDYKERPVKIGVIQLKGFSLEVAERFVRLAVDDRPDIVILPEIGCGREPQDLDDSPILKTLQPYAEQGHMYIVVNLIEANGDRTFNTTLILGRDGEIAGKYRKVHIPLATERISKQDGGDSLPVFDLDFGKVGIETCFDNYFPESVRCMALKGAEIIFFPHQEHYCWNDVEHVEIISRARAIENVLFVVLSGPTAVDEGVFGRSAVIDPTGKYVLQVPPSEEAYRSDTIDLGLIERVLVDMPEEKAPPSMRTQMLVDQAKKPSYGRRRPDVYSGML